MPEKNIPLNEVSAVGVIAVNGFKLQPAQAIEYFGEKGLVTTWNWDDLLEKTHDKVFTVAKASKMDVLQNIRDEVKKAMEQGTTFKDFQKALEPKLRAKGWWGKGLDTETGKIIQLGSPHRLKTIYNTNMQGSLNAGRWWRQVENKSDRPYLQYRAVLDQSTRPRHRELDGTIKPIDSSFWDIYYPPNGFRCRCQAVALTKKQAGLKGGSTKSPPKVKPDKGFSHNPGKTTWTPKRSSYDPDIWRLSDL